MQQDKALRIGQKLNVTLSSGYNFTPTVVHVEEHGFGWEGALSVLFQGKHLFLLSEEGQGRTKLLQREEFGGWLFGPIMSYMGGMEKTTAAFVSFNEALKKRAESS